MSFNFTVSEFILGGGTGTPQLEFYRRGFELSGGSTPSYQDIVLSGVGALTLSNALADGLNYVKLFGACEQRNLPEGYTQLDHIESSGTQYIDTGVKADADYSIDITFTTPSTLSNGSLFGNQSSDILLYLASSKFSVYNNNSKVLDINTTINADTTYSIKLTVSGTSATISGDLSATLSNLTISGTYNILIGANHNASGNVTDYGKFKYNSVTIQKGGAIAFGTYPAKDSSNNIGIYDVATSSLKQNAGTGDFTAGNVATPTPDNPINIYCNNGVVRLSPNLYNSTTDEYDVLINDSGTVITNSTGLSASDYIPVQPNTTYTITRYGVVNAAAYTRVHYYDSSKTWVALGAKIANATNPITQSFTTSATTAYIRLSIRTADYDVQIEKGSAATEYMPYGQIYTDGTVETVKVTGKNLFDSSVFNTDVGSTNTWVHYKIPNGTYTMSTNFPPQSNTVYTNVWILAGNVETGNVSATNGVSLGNPKTITITDGWYSIAYRSSISAIPRNPKDYNWQLEQGSTATDYEAYFNGGSAVAENLLSVGTYKDVQSVLDGGVTRNVGIKVLDGTETYTISGSYISISKSAYFPNSNLPSGSTNVVCTHFPAGGAASTNAIYIGGANMNFTVTGTFATTTAWTDWLKAQYQAGQPVIVIYPLATAVSEVVTAQPLTTQAGTNIVEITQSSIDNLGLEVSYKATV